MDCRNKVTVLKLSFTTFLNRLQNVCSAKNILYDGGRKCKAEKVKKTERK